jgi:flagellar basal-body rod modification protein FlgD
VDTIPIGGNVSATQATGKNSLIMDSHDFLKIMITELTHQDPLEPMKNQDLLNQMAAIQQLQSSQEMSQSFENLMGRYDSLLMRQEMSTASSMIGELVSGNTANGEFAVGKVATVRLDGDNIMLELDTGQSVNIKDVLRFGGSNSQDIVGKMVIGMDSSGARIVGEVVSVEVDGEDIKLHLHQAGTPEDETVPVYLKNASIINIDTADLLIGYTANGLGDVSGVIESVEWVAQDNGIGVMLNIIGSDGSYSRLPLEEITSLY